MRPFLTYIWILFVALSSVYAQERPSFMDARCEQFSTDIQGNLYLWNGSSIDQYGYEKQEHFFINHYSNPIYGQITSVDASIPTKIMVFYKEAGTILFLDHKLTAISKPLSLFDKGFNSISLVAVIGPDRLVLYDESNMLLHIVDYELNSIRTTHCNFFKDFYPHTIVTDLDQKILLIDNENGICFFDKFGTFEKKIRVQGISSAQIYNHELFYLSNASIWKIGLALGTPSYWTSTSAETQYFQRTSACLYTLTPDNQIEITYIDIL
ncbi:MAG: hypothetical protein MJZ57_00030 [Bacteroidales bacterium]|nr:hypothetical protein [Bacteroidales bacterium]